MNTKENFLQSMTIVALGTGALLLIPFFGMLLTNEVNLDSPDFIIAGLLLFSTGLSFRLLTKGSATLQQKMAWAFALGSALFMVWANLAVGLIGAGPNPGNLMYIGVLVVGLVASVRANFRPAGMATAMFAMVLSLVLLAGIALITGMQHYSSSSVNEILGVHGIFALMFLISCVLFRLAWSKQPAASKSNGE